jgi:hypothetical protein
MAIRYNVVLLDAMLSSWLGNRGLVKFQLTDGSVNGTEPYILCFLWMLCACDKKAVKMKCESLISVQTNKILFACTVSCQNCHSDQC